MRQQQIPGTETKEPSIPEIDDVLDAWLAAKNDQRTAADTTKIRHASLLERMQEYEIERYPFIDPATGKKKHVVCDRTPKAKMVNAPRRARDEQDEEPGEAVEVDDGDPRSADPFAATRQAVENLASVGATVSVRVGNGKPVKLKPKKRAK